MFIYTFTKNRKKQQRKVNRVIRAVNKSIQEDSLWQGRFFVYQREANYYKFEDNSGAIMNFTLEFVDKATGYRAISYADTNQIINHLGWAMNEFIVEYAKVWEQEKSPQEAKENFNLFPNSDFMQTHINRELPRFLFWL